MIVRKANADCGYSRTQRTETAFALVHSTSACSRRPSDVYASSGVTDGRGSFGYLVYLREDQFQRAAETLGLAPGHQ